RARHRRHRRGQQVASRATRAVGHASARQDRHPLEAAPRRGRRQRPERRHARGDRRGAHAVRTWWLVLAVAVAAGAGSARADDFVITPLDETRPDDPARAASYDLRLAYYLL